MSAALLRSRKFTAMRVDEPMALLLSSSVGRAGCARDAECRAAEAHALLRSDATEQLDREVGQDAAIEHDASADAVACARLG